MNITLSADKELVRKAREYARRHDSSLNALIRNYLKQMVDEMDSASAAAEFETLSEEFAGESPPGYLFQRDGVYDRSNRGKK